MRPLSLTVNGNAVSADVEPRMHLADFLREMQDLTGTHLGCEHGVCGACTLLIDGAPARSCITYAVQCDGAEIVTIEGLDDDEITRELRDAFSREHALQCGYCTPGMLVAARDLVVRLDAPTERDIRVAMSGNLCRCTGYVGIVKAVASVIAARRARGVAAVGGAGRAALGPVGSGHAATTATAARPRATRPAERTRGAAPHERAAPARPDWANWMPQATIEERFVVAHPRDAVWDFFGRVDEVAACLPGAVLDAAPSPERVEGRFRVKLGPVAAEFRGVADIKRDADTYSGRIRGAGSDRLSDSATRGEIVYRLAAIDAGSTTVEIDVGYVLTGMLAQAGRSGLVRDVAHRLVHAFAGNLEAKLSGGADAAPAAELKAGRLLLSVMADRLKRLARELWPLNRRR